jgi:hypothetical protein
MVAPDCKTAVLDSNLTNSAGFRVALHPEIWVIRVQYIGQCTVSTMSSPTAIYCSVYTCYYILSHLPTYCVISCPFCIYLFVCTFCTVPCHITQKFVSLLLLQPKYLSGTPPPTKNCKQCAKLFHLPLIADV